MKLKSASFTFLCLFLLFAAPVIIAWYFVYEGRWPGAQVNHGYVFQSAVALEDLPWKNLDGTPFLWKNNAQRWAMVYVAPAKCDADCHEALYTLHQVRIALNQDQDNFVRVLAVSPTFTAAELQFYQTDNYAKDMVMLTINPSVVQAKLGSYPDKHNVVGRMLILDPESRLVLAYPATINPEDVLKDLQRLMRAFHLGQTKA